MKTINKILGLLLLFTAVFAASCTRDYEEPPLVKPEYNGPDENITIAEFKNAYKDLADRTAKLVEYDYIMKGRIISSDAAGNIYKQIYIQDKTGGISIGIEESNTSTLFGLGQEVYINLHGLAAVKYGGEIQIGFDGTNANRIPWNIVTKYIFKDGWAQPSKVVPTVFTEFSKLTDKDAGTLVKLEGVYFEDGGKLPYSESQKTIGRKLFDSKGISLEVRTSGYSNFYSKIMPYGTGALIGVIGKHEGKWQLSLRSIEDVLEFDGKDPNKDKPDPKPDPDVKPNTTMSAFAAKFAGVTAEAPAKIEEDILLGGIIVSDDTDSNVFKKVYIQDETGAITVGVDEGFVSKTYPIGTKIVFNAKGLDAIVYEGLLQIGSTTAKANRIPMTDFAARTTVVSKDNAVTPKVKTIASLSSADLNTLIKLDGVTIVEGGQAYAPNKQNTNRTIKDASGKTIILRNSGYSKFADQIMLTGNVSVVGLLDTHKGEYQLTIRTTNDIKPFDGSVEPGPVDPVDPVEPVDPVDPTIPTGTVLLQEAFGAKITKPVNGSWPKIADFTGYDNKKVTYSDPTTTVDIRNTKDTENHLWFKANTDGEFVVAGLENAAGKELVLTYQVASNVYQETDVTNLGNVDVWYNGKQLTTQSKEVKGKADTNKFYELSISGIQGADGAELKFVAKGAKNTLGFRLTNIKLMVK